jgi:hypothetical protein
MAVWVEEHPAVAATGPAVAPCRLAARAVGAIAGKLGWNDPVRGVGRD